MDLILHIPAQHSVDNGGFLYAPRKLKSWLAKTSKSNLGEITREFYRGLDQFNRQVVPAADRFEALELMRPQAREILDNLATRFLSMGLPLPDKTHNLFDLNHALLQQMANGYKAALVDVANGRAKLSKKVLATCLERSLSYLSEIMLRSAEVYCPLPKYLWWDINHLYAYSETRAVADVAVANIELRLTKKCSPKQAYLRAAMFSLARPESLRRGDAEMIFTRLESWTQACIINKGLPSSKQSGLFAVDLSSDSAPGYSGFTDENGNIRSIDLRFALHEVREHKESQVNAGAGLPSPTNLSPNAIKRLETNWSLGSQRHSKRSEQAKSAAVEIGLKQVYAGIMAEFDHKKPINPGAGRDNDDVALHSIPLEERRRQDKASNSPEQNHLLDNLDPVNPINAVYRAVMMRKQSMIKPVEPNHDWELIDISAGGYGLQWSGNTTNKAMVGELVGLREIQRGNYAQWRLGVIRWMQFSDEHSFEIGVQALAPHAMGVLVVRTAKDKDTRSQACLLIPEIKAIRQSASLIAPADMYRQGELLSIQIFDKSLQLRLSRIVEQTGSFTQYTLITPDAEYESSSDRFATDIFNSIDH